MSPTPPGKTTTARKNAACLALVSCLGALPAGQVYAGDIWECQDGKGKKRFTNIDPARPHYLCPASDDPRRLEMADQGGPGCKFAENQPMGTCRRLDVAAGGQAPRPTADPTPAQVSSFRDKLKIGDRATIGLVIDVKPPIAKIQTATTERWYRIDELLPAN